MPYKPSALVSRAIHLAAVSGALSKLGYDRPYLPRVIYPDDIFLVSFPKSGNTWVRFLLGNILTGNQCDFRNLHAIVPDIFRNRDDCDGLARPRLMKSHLPYRSQMRRVIYLVRDGRDVAVSYYFHLLKKKKLGRNVSFDEYLAAFNRGWPDPMLGSWSSHVLSWLDHWAADYILVAYENLKNDTQAELSRMLDFIGLQRRYEDIVAAIAASDFERMKVMEQQQSDAYHDFAGTDLSIPFMRTGRSGGWREYFSEDAEREFERWQGDALRRLHYLS
jgi:hypothetical protein